MSTYTYYYGLLMTIIGSACIQAMDESAIIPLRRITCVETSHAAPKVSVQATWLDDQQDTIAVTAAENLLNGCTKYNHSIVSIGSEIIQKIKEPLSPSPISKQNCIKTLTASLKPQGSLTVSRFVHPLARDVRFFEWSPTRNSLAVIDGQGCSTILQFTDRSEDVLCNKKTVVATGCTSCSWDHTGTILALLYKHKNTRLLFYDTLKKSFIGSLPVLPQTSSCSFNPKNHTILLGESVHKVAHKRTTASLYIADVSHFLLKARSAKKIIHEAAKL